jgi:hypothetical protein
MAHFQLVTCPDTAHLETIEVEQTRFGRVLVGCTRLCDGEVCPRTCVARLDQRDRDAPVVLSVRSLLHPR